MIREQYKEKLLKLSSHALLELINEVVLDAYRTGTHKEDLLAKLKKDVETILNTQEE